MSKFPVFGRKTPVNNFDDLNRKLKTCLPQNPVPTHVFNKSKMDEFAKEANSRREMQAHEATRLARHRDDLCRKLESLHADMTATRRTILRSFTKTTTVTLENVQKVEIIKEKMHSVFFELETLKQSTSLYVARPFYPPLNPFDVVSWMEFLFLSEMSETDRRRLQAAIRVIVPQDCWFSLPSPILPSQQHRRSLVPTKAASSATNHSPNTTALFMKTGNAHGSGNTRGNNKSSSHRNSAVSLTVKALNMLTSKLRRRSRKSLNFYHFLDPELETEIIRWITAYRMERAPEKQSAVTVNPVCGNEDDEDDTEEESEVNKEEAHPSVHAVDGGALGKVSSNNNLLSALAGTAPVESGPTLVDMVIPGLNTIPDADVIPTSAVEQHSPASARSHRSQSQKSNGILCQPNVKRDVSVRKA